MPLPQVCLFDVAACAPWRASSNAARCAGAIVRGYLFRRNDVVQKRYSIVICIGHDAYRSPLPLPPPEMLPSSGGIAGYPTEAIMKCHWAHDTVPSLSMARRDCRGGYFVFGRDRQTAVIGHYARETCLTTVGHRVQIAKPPRIEFSRLIFILIDRPVNSSSDQSITLVLWCRIPPLRHCHVAN